MRGRREGYGVKKSNVGNTGPSRNTMEGGTNADHEKSACRAVAFSVRNVIA
jgi:hypothetical protein